MREARLAGEEGDEPDVGEVSTSVMARVSRFQCGEVKERGT